VLKDADWIYLAQDLNRWREIKTCEFYIRGKILTSFLRKTVLYTWGCNWLDRVLWLHKFCRLPKHVDEVVKANYATVLNNHVILKFTAELVFTEGLIFFHHEVNVQFNAVKLNYLLRLLESVCGDMLAEPVNACLWLRSNVPGHRKKSFQARHAFHPININQSDQ
jgi:hypothetical protein